MCLVLVLFRASTFVYRLSDQYSGLLYYYSDFATVQMDSTWVGVVSELGLTDVGHPPSAPRDAFRQLGCKHTVNILGVGTQNKMQFCIVHGSERFNLLKQTALSI